MESKLHVNLSWASSYNLFFTSVPICYLACFDKDVTYEYIMNSEEEDEHYRQSAFTGVSEDNSHLPTKTVKVLPLIKKNYHYLYYITQKGLPFGWHTYFWQVINSLIMSVILCLTGYQVYSGDVIAHKDGYPADFWMASFGIYTALVLSTIVVVLIRTSQITWLYILFYIGLLTLGPFYILTYLYDTHLLTTPNLKEFVIYNLSSTWIFYLFSIFFIMTAFMIEIFYIYFKQLFRPTLADYFKWLIKNKKANDPDYFAPAILENFIKLHDPIPKKNEIEWSDIYSSKASNLVEKKDNPEIAEDSQEDNKPQNKATGSLDHPPLSMLSGGDFSTNPGTSTANKLSSRSMESILPSLRDTIKSRENGPGLFVIEDNPVDGQEEDSARSIYSEEALDRYPQAKLTETDKQINLQEEEEEFQPHFSEMSEREASEGDSKAERK